jgi:hypothetical protein
MPRSDDYNPEEISTVEDLDPEPAQRRGSWRNREFVLGLALLAGVLVWVLGTWWHNASDTRNYRQAQQAASSRLWDEALAGYTAARGYRDADAQAAAAATRITERDSQYRIASTQSQTQPAAITLRSARRVQTIQPGYKAVDTIAARAEEKLYTDALGDTVVLRGQGEPAGLGLYYRGAGGWIYLQGSDKWSAQGVELCGDHIIYDMPGPNWRSPTPTAVGTPGPGSYPITEGSPEKQGRHLMVATLSSDRTHASFASLTLNPADYNTYVCGEAGMWGERYGLEPSGLKIGVDTLYNFSALAYEAFNSPITSSLSLPGPSAVVADLGRGGRRVLLAAFGSGAGGKHNTEVSLAGPDGSSPTVIYTTTGLLINALLSPDERYAFVVAAELPPHPSVPTDRLVVSGKLLDLQGHAPPVELAQMSTSEGPTPYNLSGRFSMGGAFLAGGILRNKLLVGRAEGESIKLLLIDPQSPGQVLAQASINPRNANIVPILEQSDGQTAILYSQDGFSSQAQDKPPSADVLIFHMQSQGGGVTVTTHSIPLATDGSPNGTTPFLYSVLLHGTDLIFALNGVGASGVGSMTDRQQSYSVYSLPVGGEGKSSPQPAEIFRYTLPVVGGGPLSVPFFLGPNALGYTDAGGMFHVQPYDVSIDTPLGRDIGNIIQRHNYYDEMLR